MVEVDFLHACKVYFHLPGSICLLELFPLNFLAVYTQRQAFAFLIKVSMDARKKRLQELLKKKKAAQSKIEESAKVNEENSDSEEEVLDGLQQVEKEYMDEEEVDLAVAKARPKHLLKHFRVLHSMDSFFTGGNLHFCKDYKQIYSQRETSVVRYNLETKCVEYEISHVTLTLP